VRALKEPLKGGTVIRFGKIATSPNWQRGRDLMTSWIDDLNTIARLHP
jgi:hypothetical protein